MAVRENYSRKRVAILDALRSTRVHPTAEWVYEKLKPEYSDLSLGTVYRNINKFCAENKVRSVGAINGQEHFDADTTPHSHFVCECCDAVIDIDENFFSDDKLAVIASKYGILISSEDVIFKGTCNSCLNNRGTKI